MRRSRGRRTARGMPPRRARRVRRSAASGAPSIGRPRPARGPAGIMRQSVAALGVAMSDERVGFLGLGTMGAAMAANLARAGFAVTAWNRTPGRAPELTELGVTRVDTPAAVAASSNVIVVCVSDTPDVEAVLFGPDGVAAGTRVGQLVIDCSTISPSATRDFAGRLASAGVELVDAPVSGGSEGAQKGTLTIFC